MAKLDKMKERVCPEARSRRADLGLLALRMTAGGLLVGHGAQKLFGAFGGHGLEGTGGWLESMGLKPGAPWATLAGLSEFGGGMLTALGLAHPVGPIALQGSMAVAARTVHRGKPIWVSEGGAEMPLVYSTIGFALGLAGPGRYSLDRLLGVRVPKRLVALTAAGVVTGVMLATQATESAQPEEQEIGETAAKPSEGGEDRLLGTRHAADGTIQTAETHETTDTDAQANDATSAAALASI